MNGSSNNDIMDATSLLRTHSSKLRITNIKARGGESMGRCHRHIKSVISNHHTLAIVAQQDRAKICL